MMIEYGGAGRQAALRNLAWGLRLMSAASMCLCLTYHVSIPPQAVQRAGGRAKLSAANAKLGFGIRLPRRLFYIMSDQ